MQDFSGKIAVITGGGTGMGRALARQLIAQGCHVATCDIIEENLAQTLQICSSEAPQGIRISTHVCDVADEDQINGFREALQSEHGCDHINLLFNNAGIGGGGSFVNSSREEWERTFNICWNGVYLMTRAFLPLLLNSEQGHVVNTSSVNGFRASLGGNVPHTAYSAAKFAVKGFTEALINDFRFNAPHLKASVVMPGYVGTQIAKNTGRILGQKPPQDLTDEEIETSRGVWSKGGWVEIDERASSDDIRQQLQARFDEYDKGGLTPDEAATVILDGVKADEWRVLVGPDAVALDRAVRESPVDAYDLDFSDKVWASMIERT
ncbi:MAG: SDR family oxidoreductase [Pseudomonadales bacterium]|nr:SDR family oxidoreductase [Pseudomonadales bacterium]MDP6471815.1 SDR family oxidoreductase [Pseudomonadales bacterium]MDP6828771.1 SDR family oxidoreductase [Pseudomonadales bacterium]MDP6970296.1 SDR family oxidoreductase [Pseudomonadales bacterium]